MLAYSECSRQTTPLFAYETCYRKNSHREVTSAKASEVCTQNLLVRMYNKFNFVQRGI